MLEKKLRMIQEKNCKLEQSTDKFEKIFVAISKISSLPIDTLSLQIKVFNVERLSAFPVIGVSLLH